MKFGVDSKPSSSIIRGMINETERDNRSMFLHYMIENLENGLKYVENEARVDSDYWNYIKKTIEKMDADLERLVVMVKRCILLNWYKGVKQSGIGRELGQAGLEGFSEPKNVFIGKP